MRLKKWFDSRIYEFFSINNDTIRETRFQMISANHQIKLPQKFCNWGWTWWRVCCRTARRWTMAIRPHCPPLASTVCGKRSFKTIYEDRQQQSDGAQREWPCPSCHLQEDLPQSQHCWNQRFHREDEFWQSSPAFLLHKSNQGSRRPTWFEHESWEYYSLSGLSSSQSHQERQLLEQKLPIWNG